MTRLQRLYEDHGQSPWLDNLTLWVPKIPSKRLTWTFCA
jgi:hypothetical protein